MILSILICTLPKRSKMLRSLLYNLNSQIVHGVEIITDCSTTDTTGLKRNKLIARSSGEYVVFIDDDDEVSEKYVLLILSALQTKPDCVATQGIITTNGAQQKEWYISKDFKTWHEKNGVYYRTPNHISPVKREIALSVGFPDKTIGEDYDYSMGILPHLKTEVKIIENIYHYKYCSK